jgi:hypothetical protein
MNVGRTPSSCRAKPVERRPTRASTALQGDRPTLALVKKLWKQDTSRRRGGWSFLRDSLRCYNRAEVLMLKGLFAVDKAVTGNLDCDETKQR